MRYGIPNNGFERLKAALKEAAEYTEDWSDNWEEEYGEDWSEPSYSDPESPHIDPSVQTLPPEDFAKGELILSGMGEDTSQWTDKEIEEILLNNPDYLKLTPQFNVQGQWVHTLRSTDFLIIPDKINEILSSTKELCVTAGDAAEFWNFSEYRTVAVVLEGPCKVLWNADMYSKTNRGSGELTTNVNRNLEYINEMTEGWIIPAECTLVGIKINWEAVMGAHPDFVDFDIRMYKQKAEELSQQFGVPIITAEEHQKLLIGMEVLSAEEASEYVSCDIDPESPEHLYEPYSEDADYSNYQNYYDDQLYAAIQSEDAEEVINLINQGGTLSPNYLSNAWMAALITKMDLPPDVFLKLIDPLLSADPEKSFQLFQYILINQNWTQLELLLDTGYDPKSHLLGVSSLLAEIPDNIFTYILEAYKGQNVLNQVLFGGYYMERYPDKANILIDKLDAPITFNDIYAPMTNEQYDRVKTIMEYTGEQYLQELVEDGRRQYGDNPDAIAYLNFMSKEIHKLNTGNL